VVIIGGIKIKEDEKIRAEERPFKVKVFRQEIPVGDIKTKEKIPQMISMREGPTTREIQKKPVPKSLSHIITSDTVKLERKKGSTKAIHLKTSELEEKPVGSGHREGMAEGKRWEKVAVKIAQKDVKEDERASSLRVKSETAIAAQNKYDTNNQKDKSISVAHLPTDPKSSIEVGEQIVGSKPPSVIATEEEARQFLELYRERYARKDIEGFLSLFSTKAVQNGRDGFNEIRGIYSDFFDQSQELQFYLEDMRIEIYQEVLTEDELEIKARYKVDQVLKKGGKKKVWKGDIRWILARENGALKILYLDYKHRKQKLGT